MSLIDDLKVNKLELFKKLEDYRRLKTPSPEYGMIKIVSSIFGIEETNKDAVYFLIIGLEAMNNIADKLRDDCVIQQEPVMEGRQLVMFVGPKVQK